MTIHDYLVAEKITIGALAPLTEFMAEDDYKSVTKNFRLSSGMFFPVPLSLAVSFETAKKLTKGELINLRFNGSNVGQLEVNSIFHIDPIEWGTKIFGTDNLQHPGLARYNQASGYFLGGSIKINDNNKFYLRYGEKTPAVIQEQLRSPSSEIIVGFASRNIPHLGHLFLIEKHLQKGVNFLNLTTIGAFQKGQYTVDAIRIGNEFIQKQLNSQGKLVSALISMPPLLMGPREAMLQALIRKNYGCTHFIVGRDHSGIGTIYQKYEAQEAAVKYQNEIGVKIIPERGPFYCKICQSVVDDEVCKHGSNASSAIGISSSAIRFDQLKKGKNDARLFDIDLWTHLSKTVTQIFEN